jgi:hypothetical protein
VQGPFAVQDYAQGAYCVALALSFLADHVGHECTWIPSFTLRTKGEKAIEAEADFAIFVRPGGFSELTAPLLLFGECKTFGDFDSRDYRRMKALAKRFPGATVCFCTLKNELTTAAKARIAALARYGRKSLQTGQRRTPVLVLTRTELLGQFKMGRFSDEYPPQFSKLGEHAFMRRDLQEICDFTQQVHLGIESYYTWADARRGRKGKAQAAKGDESSANVGA